MAEAASRSGSGAAALTDALRELGVELAFGLPGVHNLAVWEACAAAGIRLVGVRHEQAAAYAADGYARATGRLGVAVVTTGPGAANTLGATGEAMASGAPVLVIATDIAAGIRRPGVYRGVLHETRDQAAMFAPVTKSATTTAVAEDLYADVLRAGREALRAPTGPVYLGVPTDLLSAPVQRRTTQAAAPGEPSVPDVDPEEIDTALALIERAERPLLWVGGGALRAGAGDAVSRLAERLAAPVLTTYLGRGILPPHHRCLVPGPAHVPAFGSLWDEADLVIAVGSDLDGMTTQNWRMPQPPALIAVNVDPEDAAKNYRPDLVLVGDARAVTERLADAVPARGGLDVLAVRVEAMRRHADDLVRDEEPQAALLLDALARVPADATVLADMCIAGYWLAAFHRVPGPRRFAYPMGWGTLGFAFPAALGAAVADGGRAIAVVGDGGFLFACGELATAVQEQLPLTVVLVDDGGYGMLRFDQQQDGMPTRGVDLVTPDFGALAAAFGVPAETVDGFGAAFDDALAKSLAADGPHLVVVRASLVPPPSTSPRWYRARQQ